MAEEVCEDEMRGYLLAESSSKFMTVAILTNNQVYLAGDMIQGYVRVTASRPVDLQRIQMSFDGFYDISFTTELKVEGEARRVEHLRSDHTCNTVKDIAKDIGVIECGDCEFGFKFIVPDHASSSHMSKTVDGLEVYYVLKAVVVGASKSHCDEVSGFVDIFQNYFDDEEVIKSITPAVFDVVDFHAEILLSSNIVGIGENLGVTMSVNAQTKIGGSRGGKTYSFVLNQVLLLRAEDGTEHRSKTKLASETIRVTNFFYGDKCAVIKVPKQAAFSCEDEDGIYSVGHYVVLCDNGHELMKKRVYIAPSALCEPSDPSELALESYSGRPSWAPNSSADACSQCAGKFTITRWRHHCRVCMELVCRSCSQTRLCVPELGYKRKHRVCNKCVKRVRDGDIGLLPRMKPRMKAVTVSRCDPCEVIRFTQWSGSGRAAGGNMSNSSNFQATVSPVFNIVTGNNSSGNATSATQSN